MLKLSNKKNHSLYVTTFYQWAYDNTVPWRDPVLIFYIHYETCSDVWCLKPVSLNILYYILVEQEEEQNTFPCQVCFVFTVQAAQNFPSSHLITTLVVTVSSFCVHVSFLRVKLQHVNGIIISLPTSSMRIQVIL